MAQCGALYLKMRVGGCGMVVGGAVVAQCVGG